jgi:copper chaperone CopZ
MSKFALLAFVGLAALGGRPLCSLCRVVADPVVNGTARRIAVASSDTARTKLAIAGMTCGSCATTARIALERVPGVYRARVWYDSASAVVWYDSTMTAPPKFIAKLQDATGYKAKVVADSVRE